MTTMPRSRRQRPATAPKPPRVTEEAFQRQIVHYARLMDWLVYHTKFSVGSRPGFPDLVMVREGSMVVAELKSVTGQTTEAQDEWLRAFIAVPGARVFVWRPDDASWAQIEAVLGRAERPGAGGDDEQGRELRAR